MGFLDRDKKHTPERSAGTQRNEMNYSLESGTFISPLKGWKAKEKIPYPRRVPAYFIGMDFFSNR